MFAVFTGPRNTGQCPYISLYFFAAALLPSAVDNNIVVPLHPPCLQMAYLPLSTLAALGASPLAPLCAIVGPSVHQARKAGARSSLDGSRLQPDRLHRYECYYCCPLHVWHVLQHVGRRCHPSLLPVCPYLGSMPTSPLPHGQLANNPLLQQDRSLA